MMRPDRFSRGLTRAFRQGFTLVELMVGLAVGLILVSATLSIAASQARERRATITQVRLANDLQSAADSVSRSLRRAGYWADAGAALAARGAASNPYAALATESHGVRFRFSRDETENHVVDSNEEFGFRLREGTLEMLLGAGHWQALTDGGSVRVTAFEVTPRVQELPLDGFCDRPCPASDASCPRQIVRSYAVQLTARSQVDATVSRSVESEVRVRNDAVAGRCPA